MNVDDTIAISMNFIDALNFHKAAAEIERASRFDPAQELLYSHISYLFLIFSLSPLIFVISLIFTSVV